MELLSLQNNDLFDSYRQGDEDIHSIIGDDNFTQYSMPSHYQIPVTTTTTTTRTSTVSGGLVPNQPLREETSLPIPLSNVNNTKQRTYVPFIPITSIVEEQSTELDSRITPVTTSMNQIIIPNKEVEGENQYNQVDNTLLLSDWSNPSFKRRDTPASLSLNMTVEPVPIMEELHTQSSTTTPTFTLHDSNVVTPLDISMEIEEKTMNVVEVHPLPVFKTPLPLPQSSNPLFQQQQQQQQTHSSYTGEISLLRNLSLSEESNLRLTFEDIYKMISLKIESPFMLEQLSKELIEESNKLFVSRVIMEMISQDRKATNINKLMNEWTYLFLEITLGVREKNNSLATSFSKIASNRYRQFHNRFNKDGSSFMDLDEGLVDLMFDDKVVKMIRETWMTSQCPANDKILMKFLKPRKRGRASDSVRLNLPHKVNLLKKAYIPSLKKGYNPRLVYPFLNWFLIEDELDFDGIVDNTRLHVTGGGGREELDETIESIQEDDSSIKQEDEEEDEEESNSQYWPDDLSKVNKEGRSPTPNPSLLNSSNKRVRIDAATLDASTVKIDKKKGNSKISKAEKQRRQEERLFKLEEDYMNEGKKIEDLERLPEDYQMFVQCLNFTYRQLDKANNYSQYIEKLKNVMDYLIKSNFSDCYRQSWINYEQSRQVMADVNMMISSTSSPPSTNVEGFVTPVELQPPVTLKESQVIPIELSSTYKWPMLSLFKSVLTMESCRVTELLMFNTKGRLYYCCYSGQRIMDNEDIYQIRIIRHDSKRYKRWCMGPKVLPNREFEDVELTDSIETYFMKKNVTSLAGLFYRDFTDSYKEHYGLKEPSPPPSHEMELNESQTTVILNFSSQSELNESKVNPISLNDRIAHHKIQPVGLSEYSNTLLNSKNINTLTKKRSPSTPNTRKRQSTPKPITTTTTIPPPLSTVSKPKRKSTKGGANDTPINPTVDLETKKESSDVVIKKDKHSSRHHQKKDKKEKKDKKKNESEERATKRRKKSEKKQSKVIQVDGVMNIEEGGESIHVDKPVSNGFPFMSTGEGIISDLIYYKTMMLQHDYSKVYNGDLTVHYRNERQRVYDIIDEFEKSDDDDFTSVVYELIEFYSPITVKETEDEIDLNETFVRELFNNIIYFFTLLLMFETNESKQWVIQKGSAVFSNIVAFSHGLEEASFLEENNQFMKVEREFNGDITKCPIFERFIMLFIAIFDYHS